MSLTKQERKLLRERLEKFHQEKLIELQEFIFKRFEDFHKGIINVFDLDRVIHIHHKQSQELFSFVNRYYTSNSMLDLLARMEESQKYDIWSWEPRISQEDNK